MRPSLLKIKGLNSFNKEQSIDFTRLIEKGLFGIFGPTGSGKSSILDAITLALYGNISRDSKEFINTETDVAEVHFKFEIMNGQARKTYLVERAIKRKKNGGIETSLARVIEQAGDEVIILAEGVTNVNNEVHRIIGLNWDDFTRSVVLPQGKFSEFLKLTGKERRDMLERIFGLEQYGKNIIGKIIGERNKYNMKKVDIEGQLKGYEDISDEHFKEIKERLGLLLDEEKSLKEEIDKLDKEYDKQKKTWELQEELKVYVGNSKALEDKKTNIENNRSRFSAGQKAALLYPYFAELMSIEKEVAQNKALLEQLENELPGVVRELKEVEEKHEKAIKNREEQLPLLIAKIENCKQAEELENKNKDLVEEINKVEVIYNKDIKDIEAKAKIIEELKRKKKELEGNVKAIEVYLESTYIQPHIREGIEEGYQIEKDLERLSDEKKENEKVFNNLTTNIQEVKKRLVDGDNFTEKCGEDLKTLLEELKICEENPLKEESLIYSTKLNLEKNKTLLESVKEHNTQSEALMKEVSKLVVEKTGLEKEQNDISNQIHSEGESLLKLTEEIRSLERANAAAHLAKHLVEGELCPVCGSGEHPNLATQGEDDLLIEKKEGLDKMEKLLQTIKEKKAKLDIALAQVTREEDIKKKALTDLQTILNENPIETLQKQSMELEKELEKITKEKEKYVECKKRLETEIEKTREKISKGNALIAKLNAELQKDEESHVILKQKIEQLSVKIEEASKRYKEIKVVLQKENIAEEYIQMKEWDKERSVKEAELKRKRIIIDEESKQGELLEEELHSLNLSRVQNEEKLRAGAKQLELVIENIKRLSEGKEPREYRETLEKDMKVLKEEEDTLKEGLEKGKTKLQKMTEDKAVAKSQGLKLDGDFNSKNIKLETMAKEKGFNSTLEIQKFLLVEEELKELEIQITSYDDQVKEAFQNIERVNMALAGRSLEVEEWTELQELLKLKQDTYVEKSKEIGEMQQITKTVGEKLSKVKELKDEEKKINHKLDLLLELNKMLEGNRFVEYVAINQLKYISKEASKWLKDITRGRYALELDSSGNFIMRDDFNGGIRRSTNTLSGGETFLTSLALALALSSHIQLKGSAPLEFFFLDEGFGTLDNELLEIVMTALERLHSEKLSVGIISHVEELKNRVPIKLIVSPQDFGGEGTVVKIV